MANKSIAAAIWASAVLVACHNPEAESSIDPDIIPVRTILLATDTMRQQFTVSGQFTTEDETLLSFKTGGVIQRIYVKEGDAVKQGQLLATLNLTEVNAGVAQAKLALEKAERDFERANNLYRDSVATLEQMQNARTALELARQQYTSAGFNQRYSEIRAVSSGFVLRKFVNEGQIVGSGTPVLQINGAASARWVLKVGVSDRQWAAMKPGDRATVTTEVAPGRQFPARVSKKMEGVDMQSGTFQLQLELENPPRELLASGLFGKAVLYPQTKATAWTIPYDALLDGDAGEGYVFVTNDGKTAEKLKVDIERIDRQGVWIRSGLENASQLIVSGSAYLNQGARIQVLNDTSTIARP